MTEEQYNLLQPYRSMIKTSADLGHCLSTSNCDSIADLHEAFGMGFINRTCGDCLRTMIEKMDILLKEYEATV